MVFTDPAVSYLLRYQLTPVGGMPWACYDGTMRWAEPDLCHLQEQMQTVVENRAEAAVRGQQAQEHLFDRFSWSRCVADLLDGITHCIEEVRAGRWQPRPLQPAKPTVSPPPAPPAPPAMRPSIRRVQPYRGMRSWWVR